MDYAWRGLKFQLPAGFDDETVLTFLARKGDQVDLNITVTRDSLSGPLETYLRDAVDQMGSELSGYKLVERQTRQIAGKEAAVLEHSSTAPDGTGLSLVQAYLPDGQHMFIVTGTAARESRDRLRSAFDGLVTSLRLGT